MSNQVSLRPPERAAILAKVERWERDARSPDAFRRRRARIQARGVLAWLQGLPRTPCAAISTNSAGEGGR